MSIRALALFTGVALVLAGSAFGQGFTLESVTGLHGSDTILVGQPITFYIRMTGDATNHDGITNGFRIYSPDGAQWGSLTPDTLPVGLRSFFDLVFAINNFSDGIGADTCGFGGSKMFSTGLPAFFDQVSYKITIGPIDPIYHKKTIVLDSSFYRPTGTWKWAGPVVLPAWGGPYSFTIFDPNAPAEPSNLVLSTQLLQFSAVEGGSAPVPQTFQVLSDMDPLSFSLIETTSWFSISPITGSTPRSVTVLVNNTGLTAGTYLDSIQVNAAAAANTPQWVLVELTVEPPPAIIAVTPEEVYFNAVAGGDNPAPRTLTITNDGGKPLNWTVSNSASWLTLSPGSGTDGDEVTLSVDITGLSFDDYVDTVYITDPEASNSPVKVPVFLSVASDLPIIAVDSAYNYIIVAGAVSTIPPRIINVFNGGAGNMNFWIEYDADRIISVVPSSGTAPQDVEVGFKIISGTSGSDYYDTLWVYSNEAINSPFPVVFQFHYVMEPAYIQLGQDTVRLDVYDCDQGVNGTMPSALMYIQNLGDDDPMYIRLLYETDLVDVSADSGVAPLLVTFTARDLGLPLGTYLDTILVSAVNAVNSPETLIVKYRVIPGSVTPEIVLTNSSYVLAAKEDEGPITSPVVGVFNRWGGCMPWSVQENVGWLEAVPMAGDVPDNIALNVNSTGFPFGQYYDSLLVVAPDASNNPAKISLTFKVWKFHGDCDYSGVIDIYDLIYMVDFFFNDGPRPQPELRVGDMNCNNTVDIADLLYMAEYFFLFGPIPCGNPY